MATTRKECASGLIFVAIYFCCFSFLFCSAKNKNVADFRKEASEENKLPCDGTNLAGVIQIVNTIHDECKQSLTHSQVGSYSFFVCSSHPLVDDEAVSFVYKQNFETCTTQCSALPCFSPL